MCFVNPFLSLQSSHDIIQNQQKRKMHNTFDLTEDKTLLMLATFISAGRFPSSSNDIPPPSLFLQHSVCRRSRLYKTYFLILPLGRFLQKNPYIFIKQACNMFSYFKKTCVFCCCFYCFGVVVFLSLSFTQVIPNFLLSFSLPSVLMS